MNQKGLAPIIIVILGAVAIAIGIGGYAAFSGNNPFFNLTTGSSTSEEQAEMKALGTQLAISKQNGSTIDENLTQNEIESLREEVRQRANAILNRDNCNLNLSDFKEALQNSIEARNLGMDELADQLENWVRDNVETAASQASETWGDTWVSRFFRGDIDPDTVGHYEVQEGTRRSRATLQDRLAFMELAQMLGMNDLSDAIQNNNVKPAGDEDGKCNQGFMAKGSKKGTMDLFEGGIANYATSFNFYTCDENPFNARWQGDWFWDFKAEIIDVEGGRPGDSGTMPMSFVTQDGYATFSDGGVPFHIFANNTTMTLNFDMAGMLPEDIEVVGTMIKGIDQCNQKSLN